MKSPRQRGPFSGLLRPRRKRSSRGSRKAWFELRVLESRTLLSGFLVTGSGPGVRAEVQVFDATTLEKLVEFAPYGQTYRGGVRVAVGDVLGNGSQVTVTAPGPGTSPTIKIFTSDGIEIGSFLAGPARYRGGLSVTVADVTGEGHDDIITSNDRGRGLVSVFDGVDGHLIGSFAAYGARSRGGAIVAAGDFTHDGRADLVTVPAAGVPVVKVFDGASQAVLAQFQVSRRAPRGGVSIAVGDINGDLTPDIITAMAAPPTRAVGQRGPAAEVEITNALSSQEIANFRVTGRAYAAGARVTAIDVSGFHIDNLALAPARGPGVAILDASALTIGATDPFTYSEVDLAPPQAINPNVMPPVAAQLSAGGRTGTFVAATSTVGESTPASLALAAEPTNVPTLTPLQRLAFYNPTTKQFVPVNANDPRLAGKDVYVLIHGWAPGYITWVQKAAAKGKVLQWWQTFPGQPGYDPSISGKLGPASDWLLDKQVKGGITISSTGVVQDLLAADPKAAVLAYSWIDDSATPVGERTGIPEGAYISEARTTLNGQRLAFALQQALGSPSRFTGKLQLIGHSHGSKVATVAAIALQNASPAPFPVNQLTILDSPESPNTTIGTGVAKLGAANNNWFYLQDLNIDRAKPTATFVDNYNSYFDTPYNVVTYPGSKPNLNQIVDVDLFPRPYSITDVGGRHGYAVGWYAGSSESALTFGKLVAQKWSPLVPGNSGPSKPPQNLKPSYQQSWTTFNYSQKNQFALETFKPSPFKPGFNTVTLPEASRPGVKVTNAAAGASVALTQVNGTEQTYMGEFRTAGRFFNKGIRGVTFQYQFQNPVAGDRLTISIDGNLAFVMDAAVAGKQAASGTISVGDFNGGENHTLTFTLTSTKANSTSGVAVSNIKQFTAG